MPASVHVTRGQIETVAREYEGDAIFLEMPHTNQDIQVWIVDGTLPPDSHHNVIMDKEGRVLSEMDMKDGDV